MAFHYSERNRDEYYSDGLTILHGLVPPSLLVDLRREAETARAIAHERYGPQAQRLQPVYRYPELNHAPFREFLALPELRTTVREILGQEHTESDILGILFEPEDAAWTTGWHRDWLHHVKDLDRGAFFDAVLHQPTTFNQLNAALYPDRALWVVPGSQHREDTSEELAAHAAGNELPGAVNVVLEAGDVAFYRAVGWHTGSYVPGAKRATLHDGFYSPADRAWQASPPKISS